MRTLLIDGAVDLSVAADGAAFDLATRNAPFLPNYTAVVCLSSADHGGDAVFGLEGSDDGGTTWAQLTDVDGNNVEISAGGTFFFEAVLTEQLRTTVAQTTGAGLGQAALLGN